MVLEQFIIDADIIWDQVGKTFFENPEAKPGRIMRVQVVNAGIIEDLTGYTLNLGWTSVRDPSKFGLDAFDDVDITKGIFEIEYTSGMLTNVGPLNASLQLVPPGQGRPIESNNFKLTVKNRAINPAAIQGETSFSTLENALVEVNGWNARINAVEADFIQRAEDMEAMYPQEINSLGAQLAHKAEQEALDVEKARIDSITTLVSGSTTGDAELMDGRIGADAVTYPNIGGAIRTQFIKKANETNKLSNEVIKYSESDSFLKVETTLTPGYFLTGGDTLTANADSVITDYIPIVPYEKLRITTKSQYMARAYIFYDINKKKIIVYPTSDSGTLLSLNKEVITSPENAYFIRVSSIYNGGKVYVEKCMTQRQSIEKNIAIQSKLWNDITHPVETGDFTDVTTQYAVTNHYVDNAGSTHESVDGYLTDYIRVEDVDGLYVTAKAQYNTRIFVLFDSQKRAIYNYGDNTIVSDYKMDMLELTTLAPEAYYIRVGSYAMALSLKTRNKPTATEIYGDLDTRVSEAGGAVAGVGDYVEVTDEMNITNGYISSSGAFIASEGNKATTYIDMYTYDKLYVNGKNGQPNVPLYTIYDASYTKIANFENNAIGQVTLYEINIVSLLESYPTAKYVRISSVYDTNLRVFNFVDYSRNELYHIIRSSNVLFGKKYVACGDSFTAGDFTNASGDLSEYYDSTLRLNKTYPWWIAKRNGMILINEARSGTTMYNNGPNAFSVTRYQNVPLDTDYMTLWFGLNETSPAVLGTISDTTNATVLGAWNVVLEYFRTNMPFCKIGIIISDGWLSDSFANSLITVAKYWGYPYLDLRNDASVPLSIGGRGGSITLNPVAKTLMNEALQVSGTDAHPNVEAHKYRSTIIENFLRSL